MERISTIQTASVITQPTDATERLTLVEKLEREYKRWCDREDSSVFGGVEQLDARGRTRGLKAAIDIVKQHSDWVRVDEELPVLEHECGFRSFEPTKFYQLIDNEGGLHNAYFSTNHYANDDRALFTLCELDFYNGKWIVDDEYEVITVDMVRFWKPLQLPNLAQEKIYEQEMDKIRFCGCGCILPDGLTRCSDCEEKYD